MKKISVFLLAIVLCSLAVLNISNKKETSVVEYTAKESQAGKQAQFSQFANLQAPSNPNKYNRAAMQGGLDFTAAAEVATPGVVHIKTKVTQKQVSQKRNQRSPFFEFFGTDPFQDLFGDPYGGGGNQDRSFRGEGSGSGVIISDNHVVSAGDKIEVVLSNKKTYDAEVIGTDPSTDIALIKIEESNLPFLRFANSDDVKVGEWVLAVGNPFNLASTVTAGIVSAKARNINILQDKRAIESFIQTDAAVNPGNSGGALVNLSGELIGINTAIATPTGTFAGYSFAVPSNLVEKVVYDLKEFGVVQRAFIGVNIRDLSFVDKEIKKEKDISFSEGVFIDEVLPKSGAADAGLEMGDVIVQVNNKPVASAPELQEAIAKFRPGDKVGVTFVRNGKDRFTEIELKNADKNTKEVTKSSLSKKYVHTLGAELSVISETAKEQLDIEGGVQVTRIGNGLLSKTTDIIEGFIITSIERKPVFQIDDVEKILNRLRGGVIIEGIYPDAPDKTEYYAIGI